MRTTVAISGLKELEAGFDRLSRATQRNVLTRVLKKAAAPIQGDAKSRAPVAEGELKRKIRIVIIRSSKGKAAFAAAMRSGATRAAAAGSARAANSGGGNASAQVQVQATAPHAHFVEFGTVKMIAQPFMGPAARGQQAAAVSGIKGDLRREIYKAAARAAKRARKKEGL